MTGFDGIPTDALDFYEAVEHVREDWRTARPLVEWLIEHVGATTSPRAR